MAKSTRGQETLLFRKGSVKNLSGLDIQNGAITITTDEPGIYIDHGGKRLRIGDFIPFATMADLKAFADANMQDGTYAFPKNALYYIEDTNMLVKWKDSNDTETDGNFVLINDQTKLSQQISNLASLLATANGEIAKNATAIATETTRATEAEKALGKRIDAITGNDGDSIGALRAAIEAEAATRESEDTKLNAAITAARSAADTAQAEVDALEKVVGDKASNTGVFKEISNEAARADAEEKRLAGLISGNTAAITAEANRAKGVEAALETSIATNKSAAEKAVKDEVARAKAAEQTLTTNLASEIDRAKIAEKAAKDAADAAQATANSNSTAIAALQSKDSDLETAIANEAQARADADADLQELIDNLAADSATHATKTELQTLSGTVSGINDTVNGHTAELAALSTKDGQLQTAIEDEAATRASEDAELDKAIKKEVTDRENAIAAEVTARNTAIDTKVEAAKTALGTQISAVSNVANKAAEDIVKEASRANTEEKRLAGLISANDTAIKANAAAISKEASDRATAVTAEANRAKGVEAALESSISDVAGDLATEVSNRTTGDANTLAAAKAYAEQYVSERLDAANSMHFRGEIPVVNNVRTLPTTGVEAGDTYVVTTDFTLDSKACYIGDLIIANADQGSAATYAGGWTHVRTGYDATLDQSLSTSSVSNGGKVTLGAVYGTRDMGSLTIKGATGNNLDLSLADDVLTINMVWDVF